MAGQFGSYSVLNQGGGGGGGGTVTSVSIVTTNGFSGSVANPTTTPAITISTTITGILQGNGTSISAATTGNLTDVGTDGITITNGTGAVLGTGTSISQHIADTTHNGYLSSTDWNVFNGKQNAGSYITALTGDVTASGPGSVAATLATVNSSVGSFGNGTNVGSFTVNAKGLITAASNVPIIFPVTAVTGSGNIASSGGSTPNLTFTGILPIANGGTGSNTQNFVDLTTNQNIAGNKTFSGTTTDTGNTLIANAMASEATIGIIGSKALHNLNGGIEYTIRTITGNLTIDTTTTDYIIFANVSGGAITITFPPPTSGRILKIKDSTGNSGTNNITMAPNAGEKIEGIAASKILSTNWGAWEFSSNGTDWFMM